MSIAPLRAVATLRRRTAHVGSHPHWWRCRHDRARHQDRQPDAAFHRRGRRPLRARRRGAADRRHRLHDRRPRPHRRVTTRRLLAALVAVAFGLPLAATPVFAGGKPAPQPPPGGTLVVYDTTSDYGWLGELYATGADNHASHFGAVTAEPI